MRRQWALGALACVTGAAATAALVLLHGQVPGSIVVGVVIAAAIGAIGRPLWGYYLLVSATILADQHLWNFSPWTDRLGFYVFQNWWKLLSPTGDAWFRPIVVNTVDVLLSAVVLGVALERIRERGRPLLLRVAVPGFLYLGTLIVMLGYGLGTGGELKPALWQARPLFHFAVLGLLTPQVLRTSGEIRGAVWAVVIPSIFKALQVDWIFFVDEHAHFGTWREILGHEDSVFFVGAITLAVVLALYRPAGVERWLLLMSLPFTLVALAVNLRRAGYVALALSLGLIPLLVHGRRREALRAALPVLVLLGLYVGFYWNRPDESLGFPAQKLKSIWLAQTGTSDYDSNLYRVGENLNLRRTIVGHPLGLGFGHPFELHVPLPDISFLLPYWQFHPHNMILGMWMSLGSAGFVVFLSYFASLVVLASHCLRRHADSYLKAVSYFALTGLIAGFLVGAVDQMIWSERGAMYLGVLGGMAVALYGLRPEDQPPRPVHGNGQPR
jgi:hypothetical protein